MENRSNRAIVLVLLALCAAVALAALVLCFRARTAQPVLLSAASEPEETAALFLDTLCTGDYAAAAGYCVGGLPAEEAPEDAEAAQLYEKMKAAWTWERDGETRREGIRAWTPIRFTSLDAAALTADMNADVNALLARYVDEAEYASDVYDENESFREEVVQRAWEETWSARLERAAEFTVTIPLELELRYTEKGWQVVAGSELLSALSGSA